MPIYEYRCINCGQEFEKLVIRSEEEITCPGCRGKELQKLLSTFAFKSGSNFSGSSGADCGSCSSTNCASCKG